MQRTAVHPGSPGWNLEPGALIRCIQTNQHQTLQDIGRHIAVRESTVCRWRTGEIRPTKTHQEALVILHDRQVCEHSAFRYMCDHPCLDAPAALGYDDPALTDLIGLDELRFLRCDLAPSQTGLSRSYKLIVNVTTNLPGHLRSRCYQWIREGTPVFLVLHREGDEAAITHEVLDHILKSAGVSRPSLPVYGDPE